MQNKNKVQYSKFLDFGIPKHQLINSNFKNDKIRSFKHTLGCLRFPKSFGIFKSTNKGSYGSQKSRIHEHLGFRHLNPSKLDLTSAPSSRIMPPPMSKYFPRILIKIAQNDKTCFYIQLLERSCSSFETNAIKKSFPHSAKLLGVTLGIPWTPH